MALAKFWPFGERLLLITKGIRNSGTGVRQNVVRNHSIRVGRFFQAQSRKKRKLLAQLCYELRYV